jgi:hypothetical protein
MIPLALNTALEALVLIARSAWCYLLTGDITQSFYAMVFE